MKEPINISDHIKQLISGHLSDSLAADELSVLKAWIDESHVHQQYFNEMRHAWALAEKGTSSKDMEKKLLEFVDKMTRYNRRVSRSFWTWQRIAASWAILLIGAGALGWYLHGSIDEKTRPVTRASTTIQARLGSQSTVDMPDGSKVWLNGGSRLTYNNNYGVQDREVQLTGEGCFEVATNPVIPFVVKAGGLSIKAYGTTFNVKAYPEDKAITTTLVKGKVTIEGKDENNKMFSIAMKPNENITYLTDKAAADGAKGQTRYMATQPNAAADKDLPEPIIIENNIKPELFTSWKDDLWIIEKQKLGYLSKDFERRYNVRIVFASEEVTQYHFSGTIQRETIEQVMTILRRTLPLKYSFNKDLITIGEDKQLSKEFNVSNQ